MLNDKNIEALRGVVELFLDNRNRINTKKPQYWYPLSMATYGIDEIMQVLDSLCSFRTTMWEKTKKFEEQFAEWNGSNLAVMVNSGSSADLLMCQLLMHPLAGEYKCNPGDEILIPVVTWPTHLWSAMIAGFKPVLVDVNPTTFNMDFNDLESKITKRSKVVFPVHLMGNPCDMKEIQDICDSHKLIIIEDCCEAQGSTYSGKNVGTFGTMSAYSFFFSHHMTTMEGGMICINNDKFGEILRTLRSHGWVRNTNENYEKLIGDFDVDPRYAFCSLGFNLRPTDIQAGFGIEQLKKMDEFNDTRRKLAKKFRNTIANDFYEFLDVPQTSILSDPAWFALPLRVRQGVPISKHSLTKALEKYGIETRPIVAGNLARQPVATVYPDIFKGEFPGADHVHDNCFYIGLSPMMNSLMIDRVLNILNNSIEKIVKGKECDLE